MFRDDDIDDGDLFCFDAADGYFARLPGLELHSFHSRSLVFPENIDYIGVDLPHVFFRQLDDHGNDILRYPVFFLQERQQKEGKFNGSQIPQNGQNVPLDGLIFNNQHVSDGAERLPVAEMDENEAGIYPHLYAGIFKIFLKIVHKLALVVACAARYYTGNGADDGVLGFIMIHFIEQLIQIIDIGVEAALPDPQNRQAANGGIPV